MSEIKYAELERTMKTTEMQTITLENDAFDSFRAACEQACPPNEALQAAQSRHQQRIEGGELVIEH